MTYLCTITDGPQGGGYTFTETNKRRAQQRVRQAVADRYRNQTSGGVCDASGTELARWVNEHGEARRITP